MTYVSYSVFFPEVIPFVPGAPEIVATNAIRNAAIDFCDRSGWLEFTPAAVNGVIGQAQYSFPDIPSGCRLGRVHDAYWDTFKLGQSSQDKIAAQWGVDWRTIGGQPRQFTRTDNTEVLMMFPCPMIAETGALTSLVSIVPTRESTTCDNDLYERWAEEIAAGAIARLMLTPQQAYTNQKMAEFYQAKFRDGRSRAQMERLRGNDRAVLNMRPPHFV